MYWSSTISGWKISERTQSGTSCRQANKLYLVLNLTYPWAFLVSTKKRLFTEYLWNSAGYSHIRINFHFASIARYNCATWCFLFKYLFHLISFLSAEILSNQRANDLFYDTIEVIKTSKVTHSLPHVRRSEISLDLILGYIISQCVQQRCFVKIEITHFR